MKLEVKINDDELTKKLHQWAILSKKGLDGAARDVAARFVRAAIRNTPPMISTSSPAQVKRAWVAKLTENYEKTPFVHGRWLSKAEMKRVLTAKKKQLGREAAGWNKAAQELNVKPPAWVKRHSGEGSCKVVQTENSVSVTVTNRVPYGQVFLRKRAEFTLVSVRAGLDAAMRAIKKKILRECR